MKDLHKKKDFAKLRRVLYWFVMGSFIASLIYIPIRVIIDEVYRENTEYTLMIFQSILGLLSVNLPNFLTKKFKWHIPTLFYVLYIIFLYLSIFVGEVVNFYYRFPLWDDLLHLSSSMMLAMLGFSIIDMMNTDKENKNIKLSPIFVALFAVTFAVTIGAFWEIYEFVVDGAFGTNMQKFAVPSELDDEILADLYGRAALMDTMSDIIIDFLGALFVSAIGYISLKRNKKWIDIFRVKIIKDEAQEIEQTDEKDENQLEINIP